jgi:heme/copper-type cytochrome/quinol oxidase subunit 2
MMQQTSSMLDISASASQGEISTPMNVTVAVVISAPHADTPDNNAALIGGIVGGVVALLLVVGLIAFFVARSRRSANQDQQENSTAMTNQTTAPAPPATIIYDRLPTRNNTYDDVDAVRT